MKLRRGNGNKKIPLVGLMIGATLDMRETMGAFYPLLQVRPEEIEKKRRSEVDTLARPVMYALLEDKKTLALWPTPDAGYEVLVRFYPPAVEM